MRCSKSARRCGAKQVLKSKSTKHTSFGALLEVEMLKKCTGLWHEAHVQVKNTTCSDHFWTFRCRFAWPAQGILHPAKSEEKREGFVAVSKAVAGVGHLKRICKDTGSVAGAVQETCSFIRDVRRSERCFPERSWLHYLHFGASDRQVC